MADYSTALEELCRNVQRNLAVFEKDFTGLGFERAERIEILRQFLLASPKNQLFLLAHDAKPISQYLPRLMTLLAQFGHNMYIFQTPRHLHHVTEGFAVADEAHFVRRFHFDHAQGVSGQDDGSYARLLKSRFVEMWQASRPSAALSTFTL